MKSKGSVIKAGYAALLMLFGVLLLNTVTLLSDDCTVEEGRGYFLSQSNHACKFLSTEEHSCPADNEEDEDDDSEDGLESAEESSVTEFSFSISFALRQDRLFCSPATELVSPPPKS